MGIKSKDVVDLRFSGGGEGNDGKHEDEEHRGHLYGLHMPPEPQQEGERAVPKIDE